MATFIKDCNTLALIAETNVIGELGQYGIAVDDIISIPNIGRFKVRWKEFEFFHRGAVPHLHLFVHKLAVETVNNESG
jgi:hypothetical protein